MGAAGGYPWTHLQRKRSFNEEIWIDPLKLPEDISKETIRRKDGTLPSEWFHLPNGAETPSVDRLIKEDSPEPELEALSTTDSPSVAPSEENILEETIHQVEVGHQYLESTETDTSQQDPAQPRPSSLMGQQQLNRLNFVIREL